MLFTRTTRRGRLDGLSLRQEWRSAATPAGLRTVGGVVTLRTGAMDETGRGVSRPNTDRWRDSSQGDVALVDLAGAQQWQGVHHAHDPRDGDLGRIAWLACRQ